MMKKENNSEDPLSVFRMDFPSRGFSWAEQICQRPSRYVDAFREQFQKVCTEVDDWLKPNLDESVRSTLSTPSAFSSEMSEPPSNGLEPTLEEKVPESKNSAAHTIPEAGVVVAQDGQKSSRYVDAVREQFQKMFTEVDDWLNPISGEFIQSPVSFLAAVHEISEPTSKTIEPTINETESDRNNSAANVTTAMGVPLEDTTFGISSEADECSLSVEQRMPQHDCVREFEIYISSPFELEVAGMIQEVSKVDQDEDAVNIEPSDNEMQLEEKNFMANVPLEGNNPSTEDHNNLSSEGDECILPFDVPQNCTEEAPASFSQNSVHGLMEHETSAKGHALLKDDQDEQILNMKVAVDEIEPDSKQLVADLTSKMPDTCVPSEKSSICLSSGGHVCSLAVQQHACTEEASETSLEDSISSPVDLNEKIRASNNLAPVPLAGAAHGLFGEKYDTQEKEDCCASPPAADGGYVDKLKIKRNDELIGTTSIKLEEFEDVELGDCWDDLDHEEVSILSQRRKAKSSYKKKLKNTLRSVSWPSKKKVPNWIASPQAKASVGTDLLSPSQKSTDVGLLTNDSCESDWEFV